MLRIFLRKVKGSYYFQSYMAPNVKGVKIVGIRYFSFVLGSDSERFYIYAKTVSLQVMK